MPYDPEIIQKLHTRLIEEAKTEEGFVRYEEVGQIARISNLKGSPDYQREIGNVLGEVNDYDQLQDSSRPLITSIAIGQSSRVGDGYFDYARGSGKLEVGEDEDAFWISEIKRVREYWQNQDIEESTTFLLTWNPSKFIWHDLHEVWESVSLGYKYEDRWSCGNSKKLRAGDRVYLMMLGSQKSNGIIASGWVTRGSFEETHWNEDAASAFARYVDFSYEVLLNPELQLLMNPNMIPIEYNWTPQTSGLTIPNDVAELLELHWNDHIAQLDIDNVQSIQDPQNNDDNSVHTEGKKSKAVVNRYERDPDARRKCIEEHKPVCAVCGFDFGKIFGEIGQGFIHVHHLIPISQRGTEYIVDPVKDLKPVCPNCHAMIHRKNPPYTIDELRNIRK